MHPQSGSKTIPILTKLEDKCKRPLKSIQRKKQVISKEKVEIIEF